MVTAMNKLVKFLIADFMAFFDALTAHAIVPIIPAWVIYMYAIPIELGMIYGFDKVVSALKRWLW